MENATVRHGYSQGPNNLGSVSSVKHKRDTREAPLRQTTPVKQDIIRQEVNSKLKPDVIGQSASL